MTAKKTPARESRESRRWGADKVYQRLRIVRPARVFAIVDGELRPLAVRKQRKKWEALLETAHRMGAEGLELHDGEDNVLEVIPFEEAASTSSSLTEAVMDDTSSQVAALVAIAMDAADRATSRHLEQQRDVIEASIAIMNAAVERTAALERVVLGMVRQHERFLQQAPPQLSAGGSSFDVSDILALMAAMQASGGGEGGGGLQITPAMVEAFMKMQGGPPNGAGS